MTQQLEDILEQVQNGPRPFALGLGIDPINGPVKVHQAFATTVANHEKIRDVMKILAEIGMYTGDSAEIEITNLDDLAVLVAAFKDTDHAKMNSFLQSVEEGQIAVITVIVARSDITERDSFSAAVLAKLEEAN